jgi:hypothetical protein
MTDHITLYFEQGIIAQAVVTWHSSLTDKRETHTEQSANNTLRGFFISLFKKLLTQSTFLRSQINQFLVVEVDSQTGCQLLSYFFSAAT